MHYNENIRYVLRDNLEQIELSFLFFLFTLLLLIPDRGEEKERGRETSIGYLLHTP